MNYRTFGNSGIQVGEVGLGCWQLGGDWGEISDDGAMAILRAAVDSGVDFLDTADVYGAGRSERLIGRLLAESSSRLFVATKLGRFSLPGWPANFEEPAIREHTEASLKRLGVDALDLTQLHCIPTEELRRGDVFETLRKLRREGKIKRFGASVESIDEAMICLEQEDIASLQIIFNIFRQKPAGAFFERAKQKSVGLIVRLPLASGLLSGKMKIGQTFPPADHRNYNRDGQKFNVGETFAGLEFERGVKAAERARALLPRDIPMAQAALRWILDHEAVTVVIPGATRPEQARDNAAASDLPPLGEPIHRALAEIYTQHVEPHIRGPY